MLQQLKSLLPKGLKSSLRKSILGENWFEYTFFSQYGEDVLLRRYFHRQKRGTFVDVGAYQPISLSNTYYFYLLGWRGVNIEPNPEAISMFKEYRPEDTNVQMGVSNETSTLDYYMIKNKPFENSFSNDQLDLRGSQDNISKVVQIPVDRLENILEKNLKGKEIDFISIDVEGLNLEVVQSNNWNRFQPKVAVIEKHKPEDQHKNEEIINIMQAAGYILDYDILSSYFFAQPGHCLNPANQ